VNQQQKSQMPLRVTAIISFLLLLALSASAGERVLVFAAASMKDAVEFVAADYQERTGQQVVVSLASSGTLARQIEAGAPADIYLSANPDWMDYLATRDLIDLESRSIAAGNSLVLVRRANSEGGQEIATPQALLGSDRFAMGDPMHVPAGIYAKQALEALGLWNSLGKNAALGENVRVVLAMAARDDVSSAIVYRSDAAMRDDLEIAFEFPEGSHLPIHYPVALTKQADDDARAFLDYLLEKARQGALTRFGFTVPPSETD
jgi:molybdate transport system substrate-binding protein